MTSKVGLKKVTLLPLLPARTLVLGTQPPCSEEAQVAPGRGPLGEELTVCTNLPAM